MWSCLWPLHRRLVTTVRVFDLYTRYTPHICMSMILYEQMFHIAHLLPYSVNTRRV